jgi:hypothetical protein
MMTTVYGGKNPFVNSYDIDYDSDDYSDDDDECLGTNAANPGAGNEDEGNDVCSK